MTLLSQEPMCPTVTLPAFIVESIQYLVLSIHVSSVFYLQHNACNNALSVHGIHPI